MNNFNKPHERNDRHSNTPPNRPQESYITPDDYFDENGNVRLSLFVEDAEKTAKSFKEEKAITTSQVRKFYDEILRLKIKIDSAKDEKEEFKKILPYIKMIIPKVVYSKEKKTANSNFESFIKNNIGKIDTLEKFRVFCDFFEAVVAYL